MPVGWLSYFTPLDVEYRASRRLANQPHRGDRAKVKASRRARRATRRR